MVKVNILHENYYNRNGDAFLFPLKYNYRSLLERGIRLRFYSCLTPELTRCDVLCLSSKFFSSWWRKGPEVVVDFLVKIRNQVPKIIWFDISDSTGTTQFKVLPYVNRYLKGQILKDRNAYKKVYYGSRIFTDFYHKQFGIEDSNPGEEHLNTIPSDGDLQKIEVSWNLGMAYYGCYGVILGKIWHKFSLFPRFYPRRWWTPSSKRATACSCRIGDKYTRQTIAFPRREIRNRLRSIVPVERISRKKYFQELTQAIAVISPFGFGEICYRDFESTICGAAMVKQDMSHLDTWPNLWLENETYLSFAWDLSDLEEKIEFVLRYPHKMVELASNAQRIYKNILCTEKGHREFSARFVNIIS